MLKSFLFEGNLRISSAQLFQNHVFFSHLWWPRWKIWSVAPLKVIWGHPSSLKVCCQNFWEEIYGNGPLCFVTSRRIDWYAIWPAYDNLRHHVTFTRGQILKLTYQGQTMHRSKRQNKRNTMVQNHLPIFPKSKVIFEKCHHFKVNDLWAWSYQCRK